VHQTIPASRFANVALIETLSLRSWPALEVDYQDDWILRAAGGYSKRANSVSTITPSRQNLTTKIEIVEKFYRGHDLTPMFRITPLFDPALDDALAARSYGRIDETCVLVADLSDTAQASPGVKLETALTTDWQQGYAAISGMTTSDAEIFSAILSQVEIPSAYARIDAHAFGRATLDAGLLGLYSIATDPTVRRQGLARSLCASLLHWGVVQGAQRAYLAVEADNDAALGLYQQLGFALAYRYHYRRKD
jgi:ribosomal protein S18 acetylase RimI-like enzyme